MKFTPTDIQLALTKGSFIEDIFTKEFPQLADNEDVLLFTGFYLSGVKQQLDRCNDPLTLTDPVTHVPYQTSKFLLQYQLRQATLAIYETYFPTQLASNPNLTIAINLNKSVSLPKERALIKLFGAVEEWVFQPQEPQASYDPQEERISLHDTLQNADQEEQNTVASTLYERFMEYPNPLNEYGPISAEEVSLLHDAFFDVLENTLPSAEIAATYRLQRALEEGHDKLVEALEHVLFTDNGIHGKIFYYDDADKPDPQAKATAIQADIDRCVKLLGNGLPLFTEEQDLINDALATILEKHISDPQIAAEFRLKYHTAHLQNAYKEGPEELSETLESLLLGEHGIKGETYRYSKTENPTLTGKTRAIQADIDTCLELLQGDIPLSAKQMETVNRAIIDLLERTLEKTDIHDIYAMTDPDDVVDARIAETHTNTALNEGSARRASRRTSAEIAELNTRYTEALDALPDPEKFTPRPRFMQPGVAQKLTVAHNEWAVVDIKDFTDDMTAEEFKQVPTQHYYATYDPSLESYDPETDTETTANTLYSVSEITKKQPIVPKLNIIIEQKEQKDPNFLQKILDDRGHNTGKLKGILKNITNTSQGLSV